LTFQVLNAKFLAMDNDLKLELEGKVALVTGAGRGIGKAIALKLAEMGCLVAVNDLPESSEVVGTVNQINAGGHQSIPVLFSVTDSAAAKTQIQALVEKWGKIDILVNNAGIFRDSLIMRMSEGDWDAVMDINLKGAFICSKLALNSMVGQKRGRIINIASVAGVMGNMGRVNYSASKGGLVAFTRSLAAEVGSRNITVNAIAPGFIQTRMTSELSPEYKDAILSRTTLKRLGTPEEVAELAGFLASERAAYITGQVICIDGGL
jgi:3-oxoacyl-[acyl-carrier protein] reductase